MFYVDKPPWHGLGTRLDRPATSAEAIKAANLDWDVVKKPLVAFDGKQTHAVPDRFAVIRKDWWGHPKPIFGIVGTNYTPLQNREAFAFFDDIVGMDAAIYHTAGALGDGERIWILARLPDDMVVAADDRVNKFLLLSNSHDGTSAVQIKFTPIRVVCNNTLTMALRTGETLWVPHLKSLEARMRRIRDLLGIVDRRYQLIERVFQGMVKVKLHAATLDRYLRQVFPDPQGDDAERATAKATENRIWCGYFFDSGKGNDLRGVRGTLWAAYNGVTEFVDHCFPQRPGSNADDPTAAAMIRKLDSVWFGHGYSIKARAYLAATELMKASAGN